MRSFALSVQACRRVRGDRGSPSPFNIKILHPKTYFGDDVLRTAPCEAVQQELIVLDLEAEARVGAVVVGRAEGHRLLTVAAGYLQLVQHILEIC
jgi:hypothetical protein